MSRRRKSKAKAPVPGDPAAAAGGGTRTLPRNSAVVLASVALTILVVEFCVRWSVQGSFSAALATFYSSEVEHFGHGSADGLRGDPVLGFRPDPENPGFNKLAIHDPSAVGPKTPGIPRLLFLGDSITFVINQGLPYQKGFVNLIRERAEGETEVLNGGVPGYTTHQERLWFERELAPLEPEYVVVQYCLNDNFEFLHRFDPRTGILATEEARRVFLPEQGDPFSWLPQGSYLAYRLRIAALTLRGEPEGEFAWDRDIGFRAAWRDDTWGLFRDELGKLKTAVEGRGGKLALMVVPLAAQLAPDAMARGGDYTFKPQRKVEETAKALGVPRVDVTEAFVLNGGYQLFLPDGIHLNERGHYVAARATWDFLRGVGWISSEWRDDPAK
jgi:lysophospholipase L1-like esterase